MGGMHLGSGAFPFRVRLGPVDPQTCRRFVANDLEEADRGEMELWLNLTSTRPSADPDSVGGHRGTLVITGFPEFSENPLLEKGIR